MNDTLTTAAQARLTTPFGFSSTAAEVVAGLDLTGKRVIITGGASGIGIETARALAGAGADITLAVRNTEAAIPVAAEIGDSSHNPNVRVARLDLADRSSIAEFVSSWHGPLHVLINNAGIMAVPEQRTPEGWEMQFATNHLGHFALALGLHDALAGAAPARIVSLSSSAHLRSPVVFDDIHYRFRAYDAIHAYGQSKTANVLFAVGATARWAADGILTNALTPGAIPTNLQRHLGRMTTATNLLKTAEQGAATSVLLAVSPLLDGIGGRYFADCNEGIPVDRRVEGDLTGLAPYAVDPTNADRLWEMSLAMVRS